MAQNSPTSTVVFPSSSGVGGSAASAPPIRAPHLPFRRISLPSSVNYRSSVASVSSFDSLPEDGSSPVPTLSRIKRTASSHHRESITSLPEDDPAQMLRKNRPLSLVDGHWKRAVRRSLLPDVRGAKQRKVVQEFYETEKTYLDGLELIYAHFLTPIITSLETSQPILERSALACIFSNFIDIWNFHRSFFAVLTTHLFPPPTTSDADSSLASLLLSHFPYLSLYTPFVTAFPAMLSTLMNMVTPDNPSGQYHPVFAKFIEEQENDVRCGKLKLRDWFLSIVQRCPRYLLLLKDLIECTPSDVPEHAKLVSAHALVAKITESLNTSLEAHAQTLSLLALQRTTPNIPFQLIAPGRMLLKRGTLGQVERSAPPKAREFLLFSDYLLWLAPSDESKASMWTNMFPPTPEMPRAVGRKRAKSEATVLASPTSPKFKKASSNRDSGGWTFKDSVAIADMNIVLRKGGFEVFSPGGSFVVLCSQSPEDEGAAEEWCTAIRQAKEQEQMRLSSASETNGSLSLRAVPSENGRACVEHWVSPIWIPDEKAEGCMRCSKVFGWMRRRHHCRLCGRCVCSACSEKTFHVVDPNSTVAGTSSNKSIRACNACYEAVFPIILPDDPADDSHLEVAVGTIGSLSSVFPFWTTSTLPALPSPSPDMLMAIDRSSEVGIEEVEQEDESDDGASTTDTSSLASSKRHTVDLSLGDIHIPARKEDTMRRHKRFSMPAVALQTTSVTVGSKFAKHGSGPGRRMSVVMTRNSNSSHVLFKQHVTEVPEHYDKELSRGVAAGRLSELLGKRMPEVDLAA